MQKLLVAPFVLTTANLVLRTGTRLLVAAAASAEEDVALVGAAVEAEEALVTVADEVVAVDAVASAIVAAVEAAVVLLPTVEVSATSPARRRLSKSHFSQHSSTCCSTISCITRASIERNALSSS